MPILPSNALAKVPDFLAIGHVTRDLLPDHTFTLGGTVTFATLTAERLGRSSALVTCADAALLDELPQRLAGPALATRVAPVTTTFENTYAAGFRKQYLRARAPELLLADIPTVWLHSPIILLAPLAQEIPLSLVQALPKHSGSLLAATPQGWLRRWDSDGRVWPGGWETVEAVLPLLDALILSYDDLLPFANQQREAVINLLTRWSMQASPLLATDGRAGASLFEHGQRTDVPAYPAQEIDPTGAGDVFASAFLIHFAQFHHAYAATRFANCAASLSIEHPGITGIPNQEQIRQRMQARSTD